MGRVFFLAIVAVLAVSAVTLRAHTVTFRGTVLAVETTRVKVKTIADETKKEETIWCVVDQNTKIKRGDTLVTYADAKIIKGERIAVTIDHDAKVKNLATEIRLAPAASK